MESKVEKKSKEDFMIAFTGFLKNSTIHYADIVDELADMEENYYEYFKEFIEIQKTPSKIIEMLDEIEDGDPIYVLIFFKLSKLMIKVAILEKEFRNMIYLTSKQKRELSDNLRKVGIEVEKELKSLEGKVKKLQTGK